MSVEFRLKYIRDAIDKNIKEVLLKWNAQKVLLNEPFDEDKKQRCPACVEKGQQRYLQYFYVNIDEAVYKCENAACLYPFRNFKYKNFTDRTIFRYERIASSEVVTSPAKVENDDVDFFNISWLDQSFNTENELDNILTSPSEGMNCDIKEIINTICGNVETSPSISSAKVRNEQSPTAPTLSKCLNYIRHKSPTQQSISNKVMKPDMKTSTPLPVQISRDHTPKETLSKWKLPEMLKSSTKSIVKKPKIWKKHREISPLNVDEHPLAYLDWLDVVSKIDPDKMQEFEFAQVKENDENDVTNSTEQSVDGSSSSQLPILVEIMGTSATYHLNGNQLSNGSCLSQQPGLIDLQTTHDDHNSTLNATTPQDGITSQTLENNSTEEQISIKTSNSISVERSDSDFQIVKTALVTISATVLRDQQDDETKINEKFIPPSVLKKKIRKKKLEQIKSELRMKKLASQHLEREKRKDKKQKLQDKIRFKKHKKPVQANTNEENCENEGEEIFRGFNTLEPFQPIQLQTQSLVWLTGE